MESQDNNNKKEFLDQDLSLLDTHAQDLFSFVPLPLFLTSSTGVILESNSRLQDLVKMSRYDLVGENVEKIFNPEEIKNILKETLERGFVHNREIFVLDKDKNKILVSIFSEKRKSKDNKNIGCFFGLFNLTEIRKQEKTLEKSSQILESEVNEKTRELQELADGLEIKVKERTKELEEKLDELETVNKLMVGRELKMIELKEQVERFGKEIAELKREIN
jgi:hypothetical protein